MKYQLGYDYCWNSPEKFEYKGKVVGGACIAVLFSPIFECSEKESKGRKHFPDKKYKGNYLYEYFIPKLNKEKKIFEFVPTENFYKLNQPITLKVTSYELSVIGEPIEGLEQMLPDEYKGFPYLEQLEITEDEFIKIFSEHEFTDLQTTSYFGVEKYEPESVLINYDPTEAEIEMFKISNLYKIEENEEHIRYAAISSDKIYTEFPSKIVLGTHAQIDYDTSIVFYKMVNSVGMKGLWFDIDEMIVIIKRMKELKFDDNSTYNY